MKILILFSLVVACYTVHVATFNFDSNYVALFKILAKDRKDNFALANSTVTMLEAMMNVGAGGKLREELKATDEDLSHKMLLDQRVVTHMRDKRKFQFITEGNVFSSVEPKFDYKSFVALYGIGCSRVDFTHVDQARHTINEWAWKSSGKAVTDIVSSENLKKDFKLSAVSYAYLNADFVLDSIHGARIDFYVSGGLEPTDVPGYKLSGKFRSGRMKKLFATIVELPLKSDAMFAPRLFVFIPDEIDGLPDVVRNIDQYRKPWKNYISTDAVASVYMPLFNTKTKLNLVKAYTELGRGSFFNSRADLTKITSEPSVHFNQLLSYNEFEFYTARRTRHSTRATRRNTRPRVDHIVIDRPFLGIVVKEHHEVMRFIVNIPRYNS